MFECLKVSCHKYNRWTKIISDTLSLVTRFLKLYRSYLLQDRKSKLILPSPPPNNVASRHLQQQTSQNRSGGGGDGLDCMFFELAIWRQSLRWTIFWPICRLYLSWTLDACEPVVTNVSTTCADVIITAIVTDTHPVAVCVFGVFFTDAILSSPFSWPSAWLDRTPISSYP